MIFHASTKEPRATEGELMQASPLLVLTALGDEEIALLAELRQMAKIVVGDSERDFAGAGGDAEAFVIRCPLCLNSS
jgi:hypothetical protein